jgi:hypothetical protein
MNFFKNMDQPQSNDISQHPGYAALPEAARKEVNDTYESVYNNNQRMGVRIAQGMAFEAAKQMCEGFISTLEAYGMEKQADIPKAHPITFQGASNTPKDPSASMHGSDAQGDPEDGNAKAAQKKNWVEKCPQCGATREGCGCPTGAMKEDESIQETQNFTHKIWTSPVGVKDVAAKLHKHYPNVSAGTEHVYVHTNHPATHVASTIKHKLGMSGYPASDIRTKIHKTGIDEAELDETYAGKLSVMAMKIGGQAKKTNDSGDHAFAKGMHVQAQKQYEPGSKMWNHHAEQMKMHEGEALDEAGLMNKMASMIPGTQANKSKKAVARVMGHDNSNPMVKRVMDHKQTPEPSPEMKRVMGEEEIIESFDKIGNGDHVTFNYPLRGSDKVPQQGKGKAVMKGPHGWVLNTGGKHGTPHVVDAKSYVKHTTKKKKADGAGGAMIRSMAKEDVDPLVAATLGYMDYRATVSGIVEHTEYGEGELITAIEELFRQKLKAELGQMNESAKSSLQQDAERHPFHSTLKKHGYGYKSTNLQFGPEHRFSKGTHEIILGRNDTTGKPKWSHKSDSVWGGGTSKKTLDDHIKSLSESIFSSVLSKTGDDGSAIRQANSAANRAGISEGFETVLYAKAADLIEAIRLQEGASSYRAVAGSHGFSPMKTLSSKFDFYKKGDDHVKVSKSGDIWHHSGPANSEEHFKHSGTGTSSLDNHLKTHYKNKKKK